MTKLLLLLLLVSFVSCDPVEDEMIWGIPDYAKHKWYSGTFGETQVISISPMEPSTMFSSIHSMTLIMIPLYFGLMAVLVALVSLG